MDNASTKTAARPAFGDGPVARVVVAFVLGAFVVMAFNAYQQQAREYEAAPASVKQGCARRVFSNYRNCVLREDAARRAAERGGVTASPVSRSIEDIGPRSRIVHPHVSMRGARSLLFDRNRRFPMLLRVFVLLTLLLATALPAQANVIRPMAAKPGVGDLRIACSSAGGSFSIHADGGGYGCEKKNCDGKGGTCTVACDNNNNCNGSTPSRIVKPVTLIGILQNGIEVIRDPVTTGSTNSLSSPGSGGGAAGGQSSPPPVIIY